MKVWTKYDQYNYSTQSSEAPKVSGKYILCINGGTKSLVANIISSYLKYYFNSPVTFTLTTLSESFFFIQSQVEYRPAI